MVHGCLDDRRPAPGQPGGAGASLLARPAHPARFPRRPDRSVTPGAANPAILLHQLLNGLPADETHRRWVRGTIRRTASGHSPGFSEPPRPGYRPEIPGLA